MNAKPVKQSRGRGPRAISIMALVFAPLALCISWGMYTRDTPLDRMPLLYIALGVAALELTAAMATLLGKPIGPRLFLVYGVAALAFVIVDAVVLWQMVTLPEPEVHRGMAHEVTHAFGSVLGFLFHIAWSVCAFAWPIVAMVIAGRWKPRADFFGAAPTYFDGVRTAASPVAS